MISLEAYRFAIGCFSQPLKLGRRSYRKVYEDGDHVFCFWSLFAFSTKHTPKYPILVLFSLMILLQSGDIETNPGPVNILKSVQGTFHQGNTQVLGSETGTQCVCNALFAICWMSIKNVAFWCTSDLDYILYEGINLYRICGYTNQYLNVDEIPSEVTIENNIVKTEKLYNESYLLTSDLSDNTLLQESYSFKTEMGNGLICV